MLRVQMLQEIDKSHLDKLLESIHLLVKEYEAKHSSLLNKDKATIEQMHNIEKLTQSHDSPQLTYYKILKNLYDTIMLAKSRKHGKEEPILALQKLLQNELRALQEAQLENTEEKNIDAALDGALQRLIKHVYPMRNREDITEQYLVELVATIHTHAEGLRHRMTDTKNKKLIDDLKNISISKDNKNLFAKYHGILSSLYTCLKGFQSPEQNPSLLALNKLLILELQTQSEAEWLEPNDNNNFRVDIHSTISRINDHAIYFSNKDKKYCEKWGVSLLHLHTGISKKWEAVCKIGETITSEKGFYDAMQILGFENANFDTHSNPNLFILKKECALSRELNDLKANHAHLINERSALEKKLKADKKILQDVIELEKQIEEDCEQSVKAKRELDRISARITYNKHTAGNESYEFSKAELESEIKSTESAIENKNEEIKTAHDNLNGKPTELANLHYKLSLNELGTLDELTQTIKLWSRRNIALLFIQNILQIQIKIGKKLSDDEITRYAKTYYLFIFKMNTLAKSVTSEYERINNAIENTTLIPKQLKNMHDIPEFEVINLAYNLSENKLYVNEDYYAEFKEFLLSELGSLTDSREFRAELKKLKLPTRLKKFKHDFDKLSTLENVDELNNELKSLKSQAVKKDDYTTFKQFLIDNFSTLQTSQEFRFALNSLKFKANADVASHRDYTVSHEYGVTLYSQHKITTLTNQDSKVVLTAAINTPLPNSPRVIGEFDPLSKEAPASEKTVGIASRMLNAAVHSPLPESTPSSVELKKSKSSSDEGQSNDKEVDIVEPESQITSPFETTLGSSEAKSDRRLSMSEEVVNFVTHDSANRPRTTWKKIGIGLLIGLGIGLVLGGIAAATLFTGGIALEIVIGVSVGLFAAGVLSGGFGGKVHDYRTHAIELKQQSLKRTSNSADIQDALAQSNPEKRRKVSISSEGLTATSAVSDSSVATSQFNKFGAMRPTNVARNDASTSQPLLASQGGQSPRL